MTDSKYEAMFLEMTDEIGDLTREVQRLTELNCADAESFNKAWTKLLTNPFWKGKTEYERHMLTWFTALSWFREEVINLRTFKDQHTAQLDGLGENNRILRVELREARACIAKMPCACPGKPGEICARCAYITDVTGSDIG